MVIEIIRGEIQLDFSSRECVTIKKISKELNCEMSLDP